MKRFLLTVLAVVLIIASDYEVSLAGGRDEWGLKIGLDFDKHIYTGASSASRVSVNNRVGLVIGVFLTHYISNRVAIQPEFYYAIRGFTKKYLHESRLGYTSYEEKVRMDCLEMPLLWKFLIGSGTPQPSLFIGPDLTLYVQSRALGHTGGFGGWDRAVDMGIILGGGLDFVAGKGKILVDARLFLGLMRIFFFPASRTIEPMFSLRVGYAF